MSKDPPPRSGKSRRSVSVSGATFRAFQAVCYAKGQSVSGAVERLMADEIERETGEKFTPARSFPSRQAELEATEIDRLKAAVVMWETRARDAGWVDVRQKPIGSQHFTF